MLYSLHGTRPQRGQKRRQSRAEFNGGSRRSSALVVVLKGLIQLKVRSIESILEAIVYVNRLRSRSTDAATGIRRRLHRSRLIGFSSGLEAKFGRPEPKDPPSVGRFDNYHN